MAPATTAAPRLVLFATILLAAGPAIAQPGPDTPPPRPRLPQVISPLDAPMEGRRLPRVITPMDAPDPAPAQPAAAQGAPRANAAGAGCTPQQVTVINAALAEARRRIAAAIRLLREAPGHPHVRLWFGAASHAAVLNVLQRSATRLSNTAGVELQCNDPARCAAGASAYAVGLSRTLFDAQGRPAVTYRIDEGQVLGVCPPFFRANADGTGTRWGILLHEATHFAAATRDHAYGRAASLALARSDRARAAENADSFMLFVETLPAR